MNVSKTESPVTQVADVAVNNASTKLILPIFEDKGTQRIKAPKNTIARKLRTISCTEDISLNFFKISHLPLVRIRLKMIL